MYKLLSISVSNYRNVKEAEVKLGDFNVLIGPNNSGKTNFVRVINFLNKIITSSNEELKAYFGDDISASNVLNDVIPIRPSSKKTGEISFSVEYKEDKSDVHYWYELALGWDSTNRNYGANFKILKEHLKFKEPSAKGPAKKVFSRSNDKVEYGDSLNWYKNLLGAIPDFYSVIGMLDLFPDMYRKDDEVVSAIAGLKRVISAPIYFFSNQELRDYWKRSRQSVKNGRVCYMNLTEGIEEIEKSTYKKKVFDSIVKDILNIDSIGVVQITLQEDDEFKYISLSQFGNYKSVNDLSDGSLLVLALIVGTLNSNSDMIIIEEPENSIHPGALLKLIEFLRSFSKETQVLITTHSIALLNKSSLEELIISELDDKGFTTISNITTKKDLIKKLRKGYVSFSDELFFSDQDEEIEEDD